MIGVVVVPGISAEMLGLDCARSLALLPLCDRPMIQHIIESLVVQGVTAVEILVGHAPEEVEALLGNGDRWGCRFRYHLEVQPELPYRSLKVITELREQPWVLVHASKYPCVDVPSGEIGFPLLYFGTAGEGSQEHGNNSADGQRDGIGAARWGGAAVFPAGQVSEALFNQTYEGLYSHLMQLRSRGEATVVETSQWLDTSTPAKLIESQKMLLERRVDGFVMSGTERQPGVWISRNVVIHPTVQLVAPVYVGPNCRLNRGVILGPNAVISSECIVDTNTKVEESLVTTGSYIGEGLELINAVVSKNLLVNVRLGASVDVAESFLLGGLKPSYSRTWLRVTGRAVIALLLIVLFLPVSLVSRVYLALVWSLFSVSIPGVVQLPAQEHDLAARTFALPCIGPDAWTTPRRAGWGAFVRQFLPGLTAVASGRIGLVGLPPRTVTEIENLSPEWRSMYLANEGGLINEASVAASDPKDQTQQYVAEAYYVARNNFVYDLKLASRYFLQLIIPAR